MRKTNRHRHLLFGNRSLNERFCDSEQRSDELRLKHLTEAARRCEKKTNEHSAID